MRKMILGAIFLMVVQGIALAQGSKEHKAWGYVFGGAGASSGDFSTGFFHFGAAYGPSRTTRIRRAYPDLTGEMPVTRH